METQANISKLTEKAVMLDDVREDGDTLQTMAGRLEISLKNRTERETVQAHDAETDESGLRSDSIVRYRRCGMNGYVEIPRVVR